MNKANMLFLLCILFSVKLKAQTPTIHDQPFGKIDQADLELTSREFEKDANAEVLLDIGKFYYGDQLNEIIEEYHKRIKIFNVNGNNVADIRIPFESFNHMEYLTGIEAETINLVDGKAEVTKLDKKLIYTTVIDKEYSEVTFTMPNVKPGSIIEYRYKWNANYNAYLPPWNFQEKVPVRYSELTVGIPDIFYFRVRSHFYQPLATHSNSIEAGVLKTMTHNVSVSGSAMASDQQTETTIFNVNKEIWGLSNIPSLHTDAYTSSFTDNAQGVDFDLVSIKPLGGFNTNYSDTWAKVGYSLSQSEDFGDQLNKKLTGEQELIGKATLLKSNDEKIAFMFDTVKNLMKWNGSDRWYTSDGTPKAWNNKTGNSTEINLILYHLLKQLNITAYPMVVSTRDNGRVDRYSTSLYQFNRTVVYVPVSDTKYYVLDATGKFNIFNETPVELLNSFGLYIDKAKKSYDTISITRDLPVRQVVLINAEIKPGGKLEGTAQINSASYDRISAIKRYKTDGEEKYIKYLANEDNNLKISSVKFENMGIDTLPLTQNITFNLDLPGSDGNYIYVTPNLFTPLKTNPFLSDTRLTDIYYGFLRNYSINAIFKIPAGYKIYALPNSATMTTADKSISFKRIVAEQDGAIIVHFIIDFKRKAFNADDYPRLHDFYKKMYEMLNEQIVLKKAG